MSVLLLEVGDEFSHLVGTPTSLYKSFLQSLRQAMVYEKGGEGLSSSDEGWARWQGEMNLLLHAFWCLRSLHWLWGHSHLESHQRSIPAPPSCPLSPLA